MDAIVDIWRAVDKRCTEYNVIYQAKISTRYKEYRNTGSAPTIIKTRVANHLNTLRNRNFKNSTSLRKIIWKLKDEGTKIKIDWEILGSDKSYRIGDRYCRLSNLELYLILKSKHKIINSRLEVNSNCLHKSAKLYRNF